jgi:RNA polymerase subunit RPABC4/transcription elongation factor Spt4
MSTERFNFKAKPGDAGFRPLPKNKYGHTVLNPAPSDMVDSYATIDVYENVDGEIKAVGSIENILKSPHMQAWAERNNIAIEEEEEENPLEDTETETLEQRSTLSEEMDKLLESDEVRATMSELPVAEVETKEHKVVADSRVRKVTASENTDSRTECAESKKCVDAECNAILPFEAKFCSNCGKSQQVAQFCIGCGYAFRGQEKFCPLCGTQR